MARGGTRLAPFLRMESRPAPPSNVPRERYGNEAGRRIQDRTEQWLDDHDVPSTPTDTDDPRRADDAVSIDEVIERLSRDMSDAVKRAPANERDELRSYASELVR